MISIKSVLCLWIIIAIDFSQGQYGTKIEEKKLRFTKGSSYDLMVPILSSAEGYSAQGPFRQNQLMRMRLRSNGCSCQSFICGCCLDFNISQFNFQRTGCMNVTADGREFSLNFDMLWDGESIYQNAISAKNPPPMCIPLPVPYIPSLDGCVQLFQISVLSETQRVHACVDLDLRIQRAKVLVLHFDCLQIGTDANIISVKPTQSSTDYIDE